MVTVCRNVIIVPFFIAFCKGFCQIISDEKCRPRHFVGAALVLFHFLGRKHTKIGEIERFVGVDVNVDAEEIDGARIGRRFGATDRREGQIQRLPGA